MVRVRVRQSTIWRVQREAISPWEAMSSRQDPLVVNEGSSTVMGPSLVQTGLPGPRSCWGISTSDDPMSPGFSVQWCRAAHYKEMT